MKLYPKGYWIRWFVLPLLLIGWPVWSSGESFKKPESPYSLEKELQSLLSAGMAQSQDSAALRRLASLYLDLGYGWYVDHEKKLASFQEGTRLAKKALEQQESSTDAHFLYAANLGKAVQLQGIIATALSLQTLRHHVDRVLELDKKHAPAHHILGRIYEELPWFLGGDQEIAAEYLKKAISLDALYVPARLDLGKWYLRHGHSLEGEREFIEVLDTPPLKKRWIWERIHQPQAQRLLQQIRDTESSRPPGPRKVRQ